VRPDTVLTFGPEGMTGHPDHIAVGEWAVEAAAARGGRCQVLAATKTPEWLEAFASVNEGILTADPPCTPSAELALEVRLPRHILDAKIRALKAQASQTTGLIERLGEATYRAWLDREFWVRRQ
jgi:LmbE family N-acetylglucosaminyl deacetylase